MLFFLSLVFRHEMVFFCCTLLLLLAAQGFEGHF
jgi:hypothetical protein